jgi:hypothetical protein
MKKKITALCSVMVVLSICIAMLGVANFNVENDVTMATIKNYNAPKTEDTTSNASGGIGDILGGIGDGSSGGIGDVLGGIGDGSSGGIDDVLGGIGDGSSGDIGDSLGGIGDALGGVAGGIGDSLGGIFGGSSGTVVKTTAPATTSADIGLIIPVPAATQTPSETQAPSTSSESSVAGETVDFGSTANPYTKPTASFVAGDEDETIKWIQWIFVYTGYGLKDDGITGVLDEDTVAVVKKLQHENKLTVDGNINEEVIKAAEVLYYQSMLGEDVSAIEVSSDATTSVTVSTPVDNGNNGDNTTVILLIVILVIIWVLAIGGIVLLFVFKKKKINATKIAAAEQVENKETKTDGTETTSIKSLSDLFEEAENKDK